MPYNVASLQVGKFLCACVVNVHEQDWSFAMKSITFQLASFAAAAIVCSLPFSNALADHDRGHHYGRDCKHYNKHHKHHDKHCYEEHRRHNTYIVTPVQPVTRVIETQRVVSNICNNCGVVVSVNTVRVNSNNTGLGAVTGAIVGGVLGNQIGGGTGRQVATVAGAIGGGVIGNNIEKGNSHSSLRYDVIIHMDNGSNQTYSFNSNPVWRRGDRVWLNNGQISHRR